MRELFRGIVVKDWKGSDFHCTKYEVLNKILVYHAIQYYRKCWLHRNKYCYDVDKQKKHVIEWKENLEKHVEENEPVVVKTFVRRYKIDAERSSMESMKSWIYSVKEMIKKVEKIPENDIRRFFS